MKTCDHCGSTHRVEDTLCYYCREHLNRFGRPRPLHPKTLEAIKRKPAPPKFVLPPNMRLYPANKVPGLPDGYPRGYPVLTDPLGRAVVRDVGLKQGEIGFVLR